MGAQGKHYLSREGVRVGRGVREGRRASDGRDETQVARRSRERVVPAGDRPCQRDRSHTVRSRRARHRDRRLQGGTRRVIRQAPLAHASLPIDDNGVPAARQ